MTHDELLAKIESLADAWAEPSFNANALGAVVKLHKPKTFIGQIPLPKELSIIQCKSCKENYPCPTIQAIEKKLK